MSGNPARPEVGADSLREISHRLRSPLGTIQGYASLIEDHLTEQGDNQGARWAQLVQHEVDRMTELLRDLSSLRMLDAERLQPQPTVFRELVQDAADKLMAEMEGTIVVAGGAGLELDVDQTHLARAFGHLLRAMLRPDVPTLVVISRDRGILTSITHEPVVLVRAPSPDDPWLAYARFVIALHGGTVTWGQQDIQVRLADEGAATA